MNAAARALSENVFSGVGYRKISLSKEIVGVILLVIALFASALAVVYVQALDRDLFSQLQTLQEQQNQLHVQWGQLLLEENTWAAPGRVQAIAQQQLGMVLPSSKEVAVITVNNINQGIGNNG